MAGKEVIGAGSSAGGTCCWGLAKPTQAEPYSHLKNTASGLNFVGHMLGPVFVGPRIGLGDRKRTHLKLAASVASFLQGLMS